MTETVKFRLTLDIEYVPNGVDDETLRRLLGDIANRAADDGLMTGETEAEVEEWICRVEKID